MPRLHTDLFAGIASFKALYDAAQRAAKGKRRKPGVASFLANIEPNLLRLEDELRSGAGRPGGYTVIEVRDPKPRSVSAAPFRDRVVHHALCAVVEPLFARGYSDDSYANRKGKGTHRAIARYEHYRDRHAHVLRCDILSGVSPYGETRDRARFGLVATGAASLCALRRSSRRRDLTVSVAQGCCAAVGCGAGAAGGLDHSAMPRRIPMSSLQVVIDAHRAGSIARCGRLHDAKRSIVARGEDG